MKKVLIAVITCLMLVGVFTPVLANDTPVTEYVYGQEVTGDVKADEISETITSFTVDKEQFFIIDIDTNKVSVEVSIYDANHNYVNGTTTDYDNEKELGGAALIFDLTAGSYTIEVKGIEGEGTFTYTLDIQEVAPTALEGIIESGPHVKKEVEKDVARKEPTKNTFANPEEIKTKQNKRKAIKSKFASEVSGYMYYMYVGGELDLRDYIDEDDESSYGSFTKTSTGDVGTVTPAGFVTSDKAGYITIEFTFEGNVETIEILVCHVMLVTDFGAFVEDYYVYGSKFEARLEGTGTGPTTFTSSNTSIATVNATTGVVTTKKPGTVYIIARRGIYADMIKVEVRKPYFFAEEVELYVSESEEFRYYLFPGPGKIGTWKSSNTSVAKVDSKGKVTALKPGKTTISVKNGSYTAKFTVTVFPNEVSYVIDMEVSNYSTVEPEIMEQKFYYSGTTLKADAYVFNNTSKKVTSLSNTTFKVVYDEDLSNPYDYSLLLAQEKFKEIKVNVEAGTYKKITISFTNGTKIKGFYLYEDGDYLHLDCSGSFK